MIYNHFSMVDNINFNFIVTTPLTMVANKSAFGLLNGKHAEKVANVISFTYNAQSSIITYSLIFALSATAAKLLNRFDDNHGKKWDAFKKVLNWVKKIKLASIEMFYQQRMILYFYLFYFIAHRLPAFYLSFASILALLIDAIFACAFITCDCYFIIIYAEYVRSHACPYNISKKNAFLSMQSEISIETTEHKKAKVAFQLAELLSQNIIPLIVVSSMKSVVKCSVVGSVALVMLVIMAFKVRHSIDARQLACYVVNYLCMTAFCMLWIIGSWVVGFKGSDGFGWAMGVVLELPIVFTMACYLPSTIKDIRSLIIKMIDKCKARKTLEKNES